MQVSPRIVSTGRTGTVFVQRSRIILMACVLDVQNAVACEHLPRTTRTRRQHTIHHVYAAFHGPHDVIWLADTHQIAWLILGQLTGCIIKAPEHCLLPFPNSQSANRIAVESDILQSCSTFRAKIFFQPTLLDTKQRTPRMFTKRRTRARGPPHRQAHAFRDPLSICRERRTFIETHDNVRPQKVLNLHGPFWGDGVF